MPGRARREQRPTALPTSSRNGRNQFSRKRTSPAVNAGRVPMTAVLVANRPRLDRQLLGDAPAQLRVGDAGGVVALGPEVALRVSTNANTRVNWPT